MKGYAKPLNEFICGQQIQFVIPVYQRNYDWLQDNCDQLLSDLVKLIHSGRTSHFFGSIVTSVAGTGFSRLVIDGQQRLTTISLLLLAGIKAVNDGLLEISNESRKDEAYDLFLNAKYCNSERKISYSCSALFVFLTYILSGKSIWMVVIENKKWWRCWIMPAITSKLQKLKWKQANCRQKCVIFAI